MSLIIRKYKKILCISMLVFMMVISIPAVYIPQDVSAAPGDIVTYDFTKLGLKIPTNPVTYQPDTETKMFLIGDPDSVTPKVAGGGITAQIQSNYNVPAYTTRTFSFYVQSEGMFEISLKGVLANGGGIADIYIDMDDSNNAGTKIISGFDFYKSSTDIFRTAVAQKPVSLSKGWHNITFKAVGKNLNAPNTSYMYPNLLTLKEVAVNDHILESIIYDFKTVSLDDASTGWYLTKLNPTAYPRVAIKPVYGAEIGTSVLVPVRSFSFTVPEDGVYSIDFTGCLQPGSGAIADIYLDTDDLEKGGTKIIEDYDFYRSGNDIFKTVGAANPIRLAKGVHKFTFRLDSQNPKGASAYMYPSSFVFTKLVNTIDPIKAQFDLINQADISVTVDIYGETTLQSIKNGDQLLVPDIDYTLSGTMVTIKKEYLAKQRVGLSVLTFDTDAWNDPSLYIAIIDTTPVVGPKIVQFNKNDPEQSDITVSMEAYGYAFKNIWNGTTKLVRDTDYIVAINAVTIKKEYLETLGDGVTELKFDFNEVNGPVLCVAVSDMSAIISPNLTAFDKKSWAIQKDITVTVQVYGETVLNGIKNGQQALVNGSDYSISGNVVTIKKEYMETRNEGITQLVFDFNKGNDPSIDIHIVDTTPKCAAIDLQAVSVNSYNRVVTIGGKIDSGSGKQIVCKVLNAKGEIEFIDQTMSTTHGEFMFIHTIKSYTGGIYKVIIGGENVPQPRTGEFVYEGDRIAPKYKLYVNDKDFNNGMAFEDTQLLTFNMVAEDDLSGIAEKKVMIDGNMYSSGTVLDFAGKIGEHVLDVTVTDNAGNSTKGVFVFKINTSISSIRQLVKRYIELGDLRGPLVAQLNNTLDQAEHQISKGSIEKASKHMEDFLQHANNKSMQEYISGSAKSVLTIDAEVLISEWIMK